MFSDMLPPQLIDDCLPPNLTEWQALQDLLKIIFANWFATRLDLNTLISIKNQMRRSNAESKPSHDGAQDQLANRD